MSIAELIEMMKKRGPVDPAKVKQESEAYQAVEAPEAVAEEGIEEGDLTDYSPQGLGKNLLRKMSAKAPKVAEDLVDLTRLDKFGNELFFKVPREKLAQLKDASIAKLKPYAAGAGANVAIKQTPDLKQPRHTVGKGIRIKD
jgi:hypothetical protein